MDHSILPLTLAGLLACAAGAQTAEPGQDQPDELVPQVPAVDDPTARAELGLSRIPAQSEVIAPADPTELEPVAPGLTGGQDWLSGVSVAVSGVPAPSQLPEGMIVRDRRGTVWPGPSGLWVFLPAPEDRLPGEGAMLVAPNRVRDQMTALLEGQPAGRPMIVSGQILAYYDHNYLLLTTTRKPTAAEAEPTSPSPAATNQTPPEPAPPAEVDDLIKDLEGATRAGDRRGDALRERLLAAERSTGPARAVAESFPPLLADGTYLAQRRARLARGEDGSWTLRFDGDADRLGDGRLTVLPCRMLMLMESRVGVSPETAMTVSGRVYTSGGQGYFLPAIYRLEVRGDVNPIQ